MACHQLYSGFVRQFITLFLRTHRVSTQQVACQLALTSLVVHRL